MHLFNESRMCCGELLQLDGGTETGGTTTDNVNISLIGKALGLGRVVRLLGLLRIIQAGKRSESKIGLPEKGE